MRRGKKLNEKQCKILNNCADKLFSISNDICYKNLSIAEFDKILQICKFFTSNSYDETFIDDKNVADWFRNIGGFSIEEESSSYHIFIEDKE